MAHASRMATDAAPAVQAAEPVVLVGDLQGRSRILLIGEQASNRLPSRYGALGVAIDHVIMMAYFLRHGRHKLILSPEEGFALPKGKGAWKSC